MSSTIFPPFRIPFERSISRSHTGRESGGRSCCVCQQTHSSTTNRVVLCDGCNLAIHQLCHQPFVDDTAALCDHPINTTPWLCVSCERRHSAKLPVLDWDALVPGGAYQEEDKEVWLNALGRPTLIRLVRMLEARYPDARMYPADLRQVLEVQREEQRRLESGIAEAEKRDVANNRRQQRRRQQQQQRKRQPSHQSIPSPPTTVVGRSPADTSPSSTSTSGNLGLPPLSTTTMTATGQHHQTTPFDAGKLVEQGLPSYEEMIVAGLNAIADPDGSPPRIVFEWMNESVSSLPRCYGWLI
jgi:hypothetical protein